MAKLLRKERLQASRDEFEAYKNASNIESSIKSPTTSPEIPAKTKIPGDDDGATQAEESPRICLTLEAELDGSSKRPTSEPATRYEPDDECHDGLTNDVLWSMYGHLKILRGLRQELREARSEGALKSIQGTWEPRE
ncbi:hypothetical protein N0V90_010552 [Kalmusia sp. IMI 367209]|nr:hypothetical protein N0V90_010552 [Kalmusia sp. IMI 367209]